MAHSPKYISVADAQAGSNVLAFKNMDATTAANTLLEAEDYVDDFVGVQPHNILDLDLYRVFPRVQDIDPLTAAVIIPYNVSRATLKMAEFLAVKGPVTSAEDFRGSYSSETVSDSQSSYQRRTLKEEEADLIPPAVRKLLSGFRRSTARLSAA